MSLELGLVDHHRLKRYTNFFKCVDCDTKWVDEWSCACDDECPQCGTVMTPYESEIELV